MNKLTIEDIDKKLNKLDLSLDQLNLEKKQVDRKENELFELHRQSLYPLREILELPLPSKDYQIYQDLIAEVGSVGTLVEEWSEEKRARIKKQEQCLESEINDLSDARKKLIMEQESQE